MKEWKSNTDFVLIHPLFPTVQCYSGHWSYFIRHLSTCPLVHLSTCRHLAPANYNYIMTGYTEILPTPNTEPLVFFLRGRT